jgi:hypothetical protein
MSEYTKIAGSAGDQYLSALAESQETFLKSMAPYQEWVASLPKTPAPAFAADVPTAQEITEANFAFANKLLKQQKKFFEKLYETTVPAAT